MRKVHSKLSYANVVATLALFIALGGTSYAAFSLPRNSVGPKQIRSNAVTTKKIAKGAVTHAKLAKDSVTGTNVAKGSLHADDFAAGELVKAGIQGQGEKGEKGDRGETGAGTNGANGANGTNASVACPTGTLETGSICLETIARDATTPILASRNCRSLGGFLPTVDALSSAQKATGYLETDAWTSGWEYDTTLLAPRYLTADNDGVSGSYPGSTSKAYMCAYNKS